MHRRSNYEPNVEPHSGPDAESDGFTHYSIALAVTNSFTDLEPDAFADFEPDDVAYGFANAEPDDVAHNDHTFRDTDSVSYGEPNGVAHARPVYVTDGEPNIKPKYDADSVAHAVTFAVANSVANSQPDGIADAKPFAEPLAFSDGLTYYLRLA
jgi:hypothetical protein